MASASDTLPKPCKYFPGDWAAVREAVATARRQVRMVIEEAVLVEFKSDLAALRIAPDLMTAAQGVHEEIRELLVRTWGRSVRVEFRAESQAVPVAVVNGPAEPAAPSLTIANATDNPLIARAVELLGAKVIGVYPRQK